MSWPTASPRWGTVVGVAAPPPPPILDPRSYNLNVGIGPSAGRIVEHPGADAPAVSFLDLRLAPGLGGPIPVVLQAPEVVVDRIYDVTQRGAGEDTRFDACDDIATSYGDRPLFEERCQDTFLMWVDYSTFVQPLLGPTISGDRSPRRERVQRQAPGAQPVSAA